ncbi:arabinogalactan peptide 14-like [Hibiscus syriacus]|uniref:Arabinogalactan peptide 14-like n=2 Tax=Hibiscus syriacus TaxID=106335 RepID=A0A6A2YKE1_HIBSY|nr:uncharacterized protein LOC120162673 isoform X2 [Hibiscus syriacus]XP_039028711.1 uncharacterized protein LOC120162673 isoform X2 [Hibiscus syriacus]KAE8678597.1 arabinogalactan peptide 14-like [Hibiscus syriacus]
MEKEERNQRTSKTINSELFLQWGNRKRLRCVRVKDPKKISHKSNVMVRRRITCRLLDKDSSPSSRSNHRLTRNSEAAILRSTTTEHRKNSSQEEEDRYYTTRGSAVSLMDENGKVAVDCSNGDDKKALVWPKLFITLSSKEKEEDFMAMKGCKPPQRPKKRAKIIQRSLLLVSPGEWLTDMCQERYEVREKKSSKKRPRGLKAMGSMKSDSD